MPAANPLTDSSAGALSSSAYAPGQTRAAGNTNVTVAALAAGALFVLLALHLMGFRFAFDVSVGRR